MWQLFGFYLPEFLGLLLASYTKKGSNMLKHVIVVYLCDLTILLGKTGVTNCYLRAEGPNLSETLKRKFLCLQVQLVYARGLTDAKIKNGDVIDILRVIAQNGPLKLTHVKYKANVNCSVLKENLDFLLQQNLIEEQIIKKKRNKTKTCYAITEKGRTVLKYFNEVNMALQITETKVPLLY